MSYDHTILKGTSSKIVEVVLRDSSTGAGKTGVAHGGVTASYVREGGTRSPIGLSSGAAGDAYVSGKWCEVDPTNCPGLYQLHLPNNALLTGVDSVTITLIATGVIDKVVRISLIDVDLRDAVDAGLTNLDATISSRGTNSGVATAILAAGDVDGYSLEETLRLCLSSLAGKVSGAETTSIVFRSADDSKDRISATVTADGNRQSVTLDATA